MPPSIISRRPMHIHPHLDLYVNGRKALIPANVGIDASMWKSHTYNAFMGDMGAAAIHTHDSSGILHVESSVTRNYTLGDFFNIWGMNLKGDKMHLSSDGHALPGCKRHVLHDGEQLRLDITTPAPR